MTLCKIPASHLHIPASLQPVNLTHIAVSCDQVLKVLHGVDIQEPCPSGQQGTAHATSSPSRTYYTSSSSEDGTGKHPSRPDQSLASHQDQPEPESLPAPARAAQATDAASQAASVPVTPANTQSSSTPSGPRSNIPTPMQLQTPQAPSAAALDPISRATSAAAAAAFPQQLGMFASTDQFAAIISAAASAATTAAAAALTHAWPGQQPRHPHGPYQHHQQAPGGDSMHEGMTPHDPSPFSSPEPEPRPQQLDARSATVLRSQGGVPPYFNQGRGAPLAQQPTNTVRVVKLGQPKVVSRSAPAPLEEMPTFQDFKSGMGPRPGDMSAMGGAVGAFPQPLPVVPEFEEPVPELPAVTHPVRPPFPTPHPRRDLIGSSTGQEQDDTQGQHDHYQGQAPAQSEIVARAAAPAPRPAFRPPGKSRSPLASPPQASPSPARSSTPPRSPRAVPSADSDRFDPVRGSIFATYGVVPPRSPPKPHPAVVAAAQRQQQGQPVPQTRLDAVQIRMKQPSPPSPRPGGGLLGQAEGQLGSPSRRQQGMPLGLPSAQPPQPAPPPRAPLPLPQVRVMCDWGLGGLEKDALC